MTAFDHLIELNTRLIGVLDVVEGTLPDPADLEPLLATRNVLMDAVQRCTAPVPAPLRMLLTEQHHRIDGLLALHTETLQHSMHRLGLLERARSQYAALAPRQVLQTGLNG